jgi:hypothetical protein
MSRAGGRILLVNNTGGAADMLQLIRFECVGVWILPGLPCIYILFTICILICDLCQILQNITTA